MSGRKCKNCGSSDIEVDPARGDAVCTNCGSVLEDNIIVAEVQFEENARGASSAVGQFVSAESKGGATSFGAPFHVGMGVESREITLKKARHGISQLCNQLQLNQHCIDTACNFFKMALTRQLTRGRRNTHVYAACAYITCRTEGTAHLLIDISDVLQICCYELGRTYLRLTQALCINIPSVDPCLYILRFAGKLEFGDKTQQVSMTALRLVQRMKRDSIHSGRRPSGLCGAALLMAARLHEFNRSPNDIVKIVKVHESTLRKRLIEFGDTPSSALTLEEFMTVDLEEEQDPPSFKAARRKDKERLQKLLEEEADHLTELQLEIEMQLERDNKKAKKAKRIGDTDLESRETDAFIKQSTLGTIQEFLTDEDALAGNENAKEKIVELGPNIASMGLANSLEDKVSTATNTVQESQELSLDGIDDDEIDMYIMTEDETRYKDGLWNKVNATYLKEQKEKEERLAKEKEEGKPEKKKRRTTTKRKNIGPSNSAGEAIEKMLQEKRISNKINYDVLKSLNSKTPTKNEIIEENHEPETPNKVIKLSSNDDVIRRNRTSVNVNSRRNKKASEIGLPVAVEEPEPKVVVPETVPEEECEEDFEDDVPVGESEMGVLQMLRQHRDDGDDYYGYDEEDY
ncbi:Brf RNA polymerase III subunit [Carabus blaptoides fortunei]